MDNVNDCEIGSRVRNYDGHSVNAIERDGWDLNLDEMASSSGLNQPIQTTDFNFRIPHF